MKKQIMTIILVLAIICTCLAGCANNIATDVESTVPDEVVESSNTDDVADAQPANEGTNQTAGTDDRGISGMDGDALIQIFENKYNVPYTISESDNYGYSEYTCVSIGYMDDMEYDYSISLDADYEIVGASIGVSTSTFDQTQNDLLAAAADYLDEVAKIDTKYAELADWIAESLPSASSDVTSTTIGDAIFELYVIDGSAWMDISKAG